MSDMPITTAPGQEYGAQAEQRRAQQAVPMGGQPAPRALPPALNAPSSRPSEPVQAGLPTGPGPGPEALGAMNGEQLTLETLRALYRKFPSDTLRRMIVQMMDR